MSVDSAPFQRDFATRPPKMVSEETEVTSRHQGSKRMYPLVRQSSIYNLTLDEIQHTVCEPGKYFGSMNMDEFLASIWNVEEAQGDNIPTPGGAPLPSLLRQSSLTLPAPLSGKTVDQVWFDIHREQSQIQSHQSQSQAQSVHRGYISQQDARQTTLGEMTLEDFLVKAGVVNGGTPQRQQFMPPGYQMPAYQPSTSHEALNGKRGYGGCVGERMGNGYAYGPPVSPTTSDGMGIGQVDNVMAYVGSSMEGGVKIGRKRAMDGAVEMVVERRQRRMIKNRESAARSRARKQAYTVELEAELNHLKDENTEMKEREVNMKNGLLEKSLQVLDAIAEHARTNNTEKPQRTLRRCSSSPCFS